MVTSEKREAITKNATLRPTTSSRRLAQKVGLSHMLLYCALCSIAYPYKILIQLQLKRTNSTKKKSFVNGFVATDLVMFQCLIHSSSVMKPGSM